MKIRFGWNILIEVYFQMSKLLVFLLAVLCLILLFIIVILDVNITSTIKNDDIKLNIKHPIVYSVRQVKLKVNTEIKKEYDLGNKLDGTPIYIIILSDYKYSLKDIISEYSEDSDEVIIDSKSDSDMCLKIKNHVKPSHISFIRIIKIRNYTIAITAYCDQDKIRFNKQIKIIKNIKITDEVKR